MTRGERACGMAIVLFCLAILACLGGYVILTLVLAAFMAGCLAFAGEWD